MRADQRRQRLRTTKRHITRRRASAFAAVAVLSLTLQISGGGLGPETLAAQAGSAQTTGAPVIRPLASHETASAQQALAKRYCVTCHNDRVKTAGLAVDTLDFENVSRDAETWERVVAKLRSGAMPPVGRPRPAAEESDAFIAWLEDELDHAGAASPEPGRKVVHRLNRTEYANAVRDLLGLQIDGSQLLPPDDTGFGFDNIADVLTVSPSLLERYLSAAREVARLAVGDVSAPPTIDVYQTSKDERHEGRSDEHMPFGTRSGITVERHFEVDGDYGFKIRFLRTVGDQEYIRGFHRFSDVDVRIDGERVARFTVGGGPGCPLQGLVGRDCFTQVAGPAATLRDDEIEALEFQVPIKAGPHVIVIAFADQNLQPEGLEPVYPTVHYTFQNQIDGLTFIDALEVRGPITVAGPGNSPSRQRIFTCRPAAPGPEEQACADRILRPLVRLAYRRPVTDSDIRTLTAFFERGRQEHGSFDAGIQLAITRMLVSPEFLFRAERTPRSVEAGAVYRISDLELASRLSFFLWSSIPDENLLQVAEQERLGDPAELQRQIERMMADHRSEAFIRNFTGQWLLLRNLEAVRPDTHAFPDFDDELRLAFRRETEMFFESQVRDDRSLVELLRANYTFLNERLARHYGIPEIYGAHFRRVELSDPKRMGLFGQASVLTATSLPNRTSPVARGKWILENILGSPPPAPPPNVPALEEQPTTKFTSMRERMQAHRANAACAGCHARMDPFGFALENFDGVGGWRDREGETTIDASASIDGHEFEGVAGLRDFLLARHQDEFLLALTTRLLTYALGRGVEYYDMPAVREIIRRSAAADYRWSAVILEIVNSMPFQMRRAES